MDDPFWNEQTDLFDGTFHYYRDKPRKVLAKIHTSDEPYDDLDHEIVPIKTPKGKRTYIMMHPYVEEPNVVLAFGYNPKTYADAGETIGKVQSSRVEGFRHNQIGNAQAGITQQIKPLWYGNAFLV